MRFSSLNVFLLAAAASSVRAASAATKALNDRGGSKCKKLKKLPINKDDFDEPDWEAIIERAFPPWKVPDAGCPRLDALGGSLEPGYEEFPEPETGKFNPCYYTKAFAGLTPSMGGYPTPIDTKYPYEHPAPFLKQPGDGSVHHCPHDAEPDANIAACPKLGQCPPPEKDCATVSDKYGIGHIPPFVPLAAVKNAYNDCSPKDLCSEWFNYETSGCNIQKCALDELVLEYFGAEDNTKVKFPPPILMDGKPSSTYFRLEYGGESPACDDGNCRGPHYCSKDVADAGIIWGDFCPYVQTGENSGKYRHPHVALAALELWIANQCMPKKCPKKWLDSPNAEGYGSELTSTSITWAEMEDNKDPMSQPKLPYTWPNEDGLTGDNIYPGHDLYDGKPFKPAAGSYVTEFVAA